MDQADEVRPWESQLLSSVSAPFSLRANWGPRAAMPQQIASLVAEMSRRIEAVDRRFKLVFYDHDGRTDRVRDHTIERLVDRLIMSYMEGREQDTRDGMPWYEDGMRLWVCVTSPQCSHYASIEVHAGYERGSNQILVRMSDTHPLLMEKDTVLALLEIFIEVWTPDVAGLEGNASGQGPDLWWLAWRRDGSPAPDRSLGWPSELPGVGLWWHGGRLWEMDEHEPAKLVAQRNAVLSGQRLPVRR